MDIINKLNNPFIAYANWLHLRWPAEVPEALPEVGVDGATSIPGIRIAGDLLGVPLLKFAADSGARAVRAFIAENAFIDKTQASDHLDLAIVGGGVAGLAAALEAQKAGLKFVVYEASEPFATIVNFTNGKPIFTYPREMQPQGDVKLSASVKEDLLAELQNQALQAAVPFEIRRVDRIVRKGKMLEVQFTEPNTAVRTTRVLICTGRSGDHYKLDVSGEDLDKVHNRLFDPKDYTGKKVMVVGGGDSALEAAISLSEAGAEVTLSYRGSNFTRPKQENIDQAQALLGSQILYQTRVTRIETDKVYLHDAENTQIELPNDAVFVLIGREAPVDFFHRTGISIRGHWSLRKTIGFAFTLLAVLFIYRWKTENSAVADLFLEKSWFPNNIDVAIGPTENPLVKILQHEVNSPGFYYELLYTLVIIVFGIRRMLRTPTPYVRWQTTSLILVQTIPLFILPYFILPLFGEWGLFETDAGEWLADQLFPVGDGGDREYWRSVGFILAWPLFIWNVFTPQPNLLWLVIAFLQTFVLIPWLVRRYGKGVYCGWICSCGALAETLGDAQRAKMPHGPVWNKVNMAGQVILGGVLVLLGLRVVSWLLHSQPTGEAVGALFTQLTFDYTLLGIPLNYSAVVDYFLSGLIGLGLYFHFSGRTWCRFFCPLAALMNIYGRFSQFRIFAEKEKCISCNVCSSVCHQGIDVGAVAVSHR
ncbi:FAD-dependent oxidoreductase [Methylomonas sp. YC3]